VVAQIEASTEYRTIQVQKAYQQFLHRAAEPDGVNFWVNFLQQGNTVEQMDAGIISSPEYVQQRGAGNNDTFLSIIFQDALSRAVNPTDRAFFTPQFSNFTPDQIAAEVLSSPKFRQDLVNADFQQFLHRGADTIGLNFYTGALAAGQTDEQVAASSGGSDEFFRPL
jgi:hypothetical protein